MYLTFLISQLIVAVVANPFHKYPYVFLLDVGNEEIENTVTEQLRVSIPGGSVALKYPARTDGDPIAHVRVSGVDFGTDLKANIVEGGPGYNYVVLVFMGNPGVSYDAVITIETVANDGNTQNDPIDINDDTIGNDSAEDMSDDSDTKVYYEDSKKELIESSNDIHKFDNEELAIEKNYRDDQVGDDSAGDSDNNNEVDGDEIQDYAEQNNNHEIPDDSDNTVRNSVNNEKYAKYEGFRPQLYGGARIYPQAALYIDNNNYARPVYDPEIHDDAPTYDGNVNSDGYNDSNNNLKQDNSLVVE